MAAAATTALDDQIPALLKALSDSGQRANTLVMFTGDNGFLYGRHGGWSKGWALDPIVMFEEVIRVPMIFNWPGKLASGKVRRESVSFYDVAPTLLEAAGLDARLDSNTYCGATS
jgi:arylsulfatase A-like enzyme